MRSVIYALSVAAVLGLAFWAYRTGYDTRATERTVARLEREIGQRHQELSMLRTEWAYLNRPDRLFALIRLNEERLDLVPLAPDHFALADQVAYPPPPVQALWARGEALERKIGDVVIMSNRIAPEPPKPEPPRLADDGEQLP